MSEENKNTEPEQSAENIPKEIIFADENPIPEGEAVAADQPQTINPKLQTEKMEVHHHGHVHEKKKWREYLFQFLMLFLAVTLGFLAENQREHYIENERMHRFLKSMQLDIESNRVVLDSAIRENSKMIIAYDTLVNQLNTSVPTFDRAAFARKHGAVWYRGFLNRNETFEQMKTSGSLRYIKNFDLLTAILDYQRKCNFAQYRTEHFEQKYYTEIFLPAIYKNYDIACLHMLDSAYTNNPVLMAEQLKHNDIISGADAKKFRDEVGSAFMLRLERMRVSITAYKIARDKGQEMVTLIEKEIH